MAAEHILKIARSEGEGNFVMLNVKSKGSKPLDIALLATDGDSAWASSIRQSRISRLRSKSSPVDDAEWEDVLCSTLLTHQYENRQKPKSAEKLELTSLMAGDQLTLIVRRNISGITQRLGEITLQILDEDEASDRVELLDWVGVAVDRATSLEMKIGDLSMKCEDHDRTIQMLNQQLEDLIEAKKEHETLLLEKFRELLNAKKLKIRDQQRLLAGAKVNHQKAEQIQAIRQSESRRPPGRSRASKRKANCVSPTKAKSESDNDMDFEKVPSEEPENNNEETPPHSDVDATEDESEDEAMDLAPPPRETAKGRVLESHKVEKSPTHRDEVLALPPRRKLPLAKENATSKSTATSPTPAPMKSTKYDDENGSETSDDEL